MCPRFTENNSYWSRHHESAERYLRLLGSLSKLADPSFAKNLITSMQLGLPQDPDGLRKHPEWQYQDVIQFVVKIASTIQDSKSAELLDATVKVIDPYLREHARRTMFDRPSRPLDWKQSDSGTRLDRCQECSQLRDFLRSGTMSTISFTATRVVRKHLERSLHGTFCKLNTTKLAHNRLSTLIIKKTNKRYENALIAWNEKIRLRQLTLQPMRNDFWEQALGAQMYNATVLLDGSQPPDLPLQTIEAPQARSAPVEGELKPVVIELSDDDCDGM